MIRFRFLSIMIFMLFSALQLSAVMEPRYERARKKRLEKQARRMRSKARVVLKIRVLKVDEGPWMEYPGRNIWKRKEITVLAGVLKVKKGRYPHPAVTIRYYVKTYAPGAAGPMIWNPKQLVKGSAYTVWLDRKDGSWRAAAGMLSFE